MDLTIVDVSHIGGVAVGDEVILIGQGTGKASGKTVDAVELARLCESVPYEFSAACRKECREFISEPPAISKQLNAVRLLSAKILPLNQPQSPIPPIAVFLEDR